LLNPNTRTCPVFRSRADAELTLRCYRALPLLLRDASAGQPESNPWGVQLTTMAGMTADAALFRSWAQLLAAGARAGAHGRLITGEQTWLPLYEAKLVHQYDHRFARYDDAGTTTRQLTDAEHRDPDTVPQPRYWVAASHVDAQLAGRWPHGWLLGFRDIARATDVRTAICSLVPRSGVTGINLMLITGTHPDTAARACLLYANANSVVFDYIARQKIGGTHLNQMYLKQLPIVPPERYDQTLRRMVIARVLELSYTAWDLAPFAHELGHRGPPFAWDVARRAVLRAELDGIYAQLYGLTRDEFARVLDTFPLIAKHDRRDWGELRTRRMCLAAWDYFAPAAQTALLSAVQRSELALRQLVIDTLGDDIARVPQALRDDQAAERVKLRRPPHASSVRDVLDGAGLWFVERIIVALRTHFVPFADDLDQLPQRLYALRQLRNQLVHPTGIWIADDIRRPGEAALAWLLPRLGIDIAVTPAVCWEPPAT